MSKSPDIPASGPLPVPSTPDEARLALKAEAFEAPNVQTVRLVTMEFTSLCPRTGQPDHGSVNIEYVPDQLCLESKSLKYYLWSYRNEGEFCEGLSARIAALACSCRKLPSSKNYSNLDEMCREIQEGNEKGKVSWIVIVAEGKAKGSDIAEIITNKTGLETRVAVLGHIQRGGRPTAIDRLLGARLGNYTVNVLKDGLTDHCVGFKDGKFFTVPLSEAIQPKEIDVDGYYRLIKILT